jgi:lysophospholipase
LRTHSGAQIPVAEVRSDGRENMIGALIVAGAYDIPEVCVYFNNSLLRGNRVTKMDNSALNAFQSPNCPPLATMEIDINGARRLGCISRFNRLGYF